MPVGRGGDQGRHRYVKRFHARIGVGPAVIELVFDQLTQERTQRRALEQERARRHQETDCELDRVDRVDEPFGLDEVQQLTIVVERGPRREGHPGGTQRDAGCRGELYRRLDVGARVPFVEMREDGVAQRLRRGHDERAAEPRELRQPIAVAQQVLDLRREVERERRKRLVQRPRDGQRVAGTVEEIGIAERDVRGAGLHLLADVREQHLDRHDEEPPAVDRRDRTVSAQMLAAAARLDVADELEPVVALEVRVFLE